MPGPNPQVQAAGAPAPREVSERDKALARSILGRINAALELRSEDHTRWARNRKLLSGVCPDTGKRIATNLHFANLAAMRPQVYAKDPEFAVQPTKAVPEEGLEAARAFGATAEAVLEKLLIRDAKLKRLAKKSLTSAYACSVGWWKVSWQEGRQDPLITNRLRDIQDNLATLQQQRQALDDPAVAGDIDLRIAALQQTMAGLQTQSEVRIGRGTPVDFILPEDVIVVDPSIRDVTDYARAAGIAHRVWMTKEKFEREFGFKPERAKTFREKTGAEPKSGQAAATGADGLVCVFEFWDSDAGRVHTVCDGEEGFCRESWSPDWTGRRWYPFFLLAFNEIDGSYYPLSDIDLTAEVVKEYNEDRAALRDDRKDGRPFTVVRKGGSLTPTDVENIRNRKGNDIITVEGAGNQPLANDIQAVTLGQVNPTLYDTAPARQDMEMLVGGGDAARGSVLQAKTATEAEILAQGMRGRSAERVDIIEDLLSEVGEYVLEVALRKLTEQEVRRIAGPDAVWPSLTVDEVFDQVLVRVRGGSTGKPNELQQQDRWTKLLPVIESTIKRVAEVRAAGQEGLAQAAIALLRETMRRFDERFELEQYLPAPKEGETPPDGQGADPQLLQQAQQIMQQLQERIDQLEQQLADKQADLQADVEKARINAEASIESAERTARIKAAADVEVARITAALQPPMQPQEPGSLQRAVGAVVADGEPTGPA